MKMKNKIELKKSIIISIFVILIWSSIFALFNLYQYSVYTNNFNNKIDQIVTKIATEYPDIQKSDVIEILNGDEKANGNILKEYGIDLKKESIVMENDKYSNMFIILNVGILILLWISLLIVFLKYNNSKDKKLKEITQYIEEINRKNYKLNIDDNTEDELSILKNEVYKTTIMLKEKAKAMNALLVLSCNYKEEIDEQFISTRYYMYISKSKAGTQYLDSLSGQATISDEGQYKVNTFLIWQPKENGDSIFEGNIF